MRRRSWASTPPSYEKKFARQPSNVRIMSKSAPGVDILPFERFFIEAACNDQKSPAEYAELHDDLREFDEKMRVDARTEWQQQVLQNLPAGLFERLVVRQPGQDIETTGTSEEQQLLLRKVFLESGEYTRSHEQDMEIVKDLESRPCAGR